MKTEFISLFAELNAKELENLMVEVKETVAHNVEPKKVNYTFIAANLWNIHKMKRNTARRGNYIS